MGAGLHQPHGWWLVFIMQPHRWRLVFISHMDGGWSSSATWMEAGRHQPHRSQPSDGPGLAVSSGSILGIGLFWRADKLIVLYALFLKSIECFNCHSREIQVGDFRGKFSRAWRKQRKLSDPIGCFVYEQSPPCGTTKPIVVVYVYTVPRVDVAFADM